MFIVKALEVHTNQASETRDLGEKLGKAAKESMLFLLSGDLGAGKTTLTQGIARGLGITERVTSPTFTILKVYQGRLPLYHIDAYRLEGIHQDLGFEEYMDDDGLCVIEWSEFLEELEYEEYLKITIQLEEEDKRLIHLEAFGKQYESLLEEIA